MKSGSETDIDNFNFVDRPDSGTLAESFALKLMIHPESVFPGFVRSEFSQDSWQRRIGRRALIDLRSVEENKSLQMDLKAVGFLGRAIARIRGQEPKVYSLIYPTELITTAFE